MLETYECSPLDHGGYPNQINTVLGSLITSWAGGRPDPFTGRPSFHSGLDLVPKNPFRKPLYAVVRGRISQSWDTSGGGWWTRLESVSTPDQFGYGHADGYFIPSLNGRIVEAGQVIAYLGTSGRSTGNHLHFSHKANARSNWGDPYPALLRTQLANRYPGTPANINPFTPLIPSTDTGEDEMTVRILIDETDGAVYQTEGRFKGYLKSEGDIKYLISLGAIDARDKPGKRSLDLLYSLDAMTGVENVPGA